MTSSDSSTFVGGGRRAPTPKPEPMVRGAMPPGTALGRFRLVKVLGKGGMGQVYAAWDPRLKRRVAIKVMLDDDPLHAKRFVREARAQANLSHPGICPVYEVGEADGVAFIVMQRLRGRRLDEATADLPLEAKLQLVRQIAEAVHHAHAAGLVHRDLKPSNLLVETPADGPPRPYVLDFGLARPLGIDQGLTREGSVVGTPAYMAPEQILGEKEALGPRTDIYALGVTLYRLVAGHTPFQTTGASLVYRIMTRDPPQLPPSVPADVSAIIFKCLEKEPDRRYASAQDLADDLRRYLEGKPVLARPLSARYRLIKWARRHPPLAATLMVLALVLTVAVSWSLYAEQRASHRQQLVASFTEQVEEMEAVVRYSHMSPLHDIRPDRQLLRSRMAQIRNDMESKGPLVADAGHFALGRGHLALEELEDAHRHLESAGHAGYQTREVAAALAQTLSALYRREVSDIELVHDWESRQRRLAQLDEVYGEAVRVQLSRGRRGDGASPILDTLTHFHDDRFEEALDELQASREHRPWSYELPKLEGEIRRAWAIKKHFDGDRHGALEQLDSALEAYDRAAEVASGDPSIHRATAEVIYQRLELLASEQTVVPEQVEAGLAAAERALFADPDDARARLWKARIHRQAAARLRHRDEDPMDQLQLAVDEATRAAGELDSAASWRELARSQWEWSRWLASRGENPQPRLDLASAALSHVPTTRREYYDDQMAALIKHTRARHRASVGDDAVADYEAAIDAYRAAIARHSAPFGGWINLGACYLSLAELPTIEDPSDYMQQAIEAFTRAQQFQPEHGLPAFYLGRAYVRLAQSSNGFWEERDSSWATQALDAYGRALERAPSMFQALIGIGEVHHLQALQAHSRDDDPTAFFERARNANERALEIAPKSSLALGNLAWTLYFEGKYRVREGRHPGMLLERAVEVASLAFDIGGSPWARLCLASAHRLQAEWILQAFESGGDISVLAEFDETASAARKTLQAVLDINPKNAEAYLSLGRLATLEARRLHLAGEDPRSALADASDRLASALELEPSDANFWLASAYLALEEAQIGPRSDEARRRGLQAVARALELRTGWIVAEAVQKSLLKARDDNSHASHPVPEN